MNKTKLIPPFVMLMATAIVAVVTYLRDYSFDAWLILVFGVMVLFLFLGESLRQVVDYFLIVNDRKRRAEKEAEEMEQQEAERLLRESEEAFEGNEVNDLPPL